MIRESRGDESPAELRSIDSESTAVSGLLRRIHAGFDRRLESAFGGDAFDRRAAIGGLRTRNRDQHAERAEP